MNIRPELPEDHDGVRAINASAFESNAEASLVDTLRVEANPIVSLVAKLDGQIVGHILFSPATLAGHPGISIMGLAPMAVAPEHQRKGIGSALVIAGIEACKQLEIMALIVLGHPKYYPKFGFVPSTQYEIISEYKVPEDVFMVCEIEQNALDGVSGTVSYHSAFGDL